MERSNSRWPRWLLELPLQHIEAHRYQSLNQLQKRSRVYSAVRRSANVKPENREYWTLSGVEARALRKADRANILDV